MDISKLRSAVIEKQERILNELTSLGYEEVIHLMASLSSIISNLDKVQADEDVRCNKLLVTEMERGSAFSKAEAIMKCSEAYLSYKNVLSLKHCAMRGLGLARIHAQRLLKTKVVDDLEDAAHDDAST